MVSRRIVIRAGWGLFDQVVSSLTNFGLGFAMARVGTTAEFGAYGLVFATYLIAINITRPIAYELVIIRFTGKEPPVWLQALREATGTTIVAGAAMGLVCLVIGWIAGGFTGFAFAVIGLGIPGLVLQDGWRLVFFAEARGRAAAINDLVWAAVVFGSMIVLIPTGLASAEALLLAWVVGANAAAGIGFIQARIRPDLGAVRRWWTTHRDLGRPLLVEHVALNVTNELTPYAIGTIAGIVAVGAMRASQLLMGPVNVMYQSIALVALPEAVRLAQSRRDRLVIAAVLFSGGLVGLALAAGIFLLALPDSVGRTFLGATWDQARDVIFSYTLLMAAMMACAGPMLGLRALARGRDTLIVGVTRAGLALVGAIIGASAGGAPAAALGMAAGHWIGAAVAWWLFVGSVRHHGDKLVSSLDDRPLSTPSAAGFEAP